MKKLLLSVLSVAALSFAGCAETDSASGRVVLAYVTSWSDGMPDPTFVTHINYAFGHVTDSFDGVRVDNPDRLRAIAALKAQKPELKVLLSVGGWGSGRFSEMAAEDSLRRSFAADCARTVDEFGLDGIDIDWEYPSSDAAGISSSPEDTHNFTLLMRDLREALGGKHLLTLASSAWGEYIDFADIAGYVDFVNIMTYDMGRPPLHHSAFDRSERSGEMYCTVSVQRHVEAGFPIDRLVLGIPFYGHGRNGIPDFIDYRRILQLPEYASARWDEEACVPYLADENGEMICCYDDPRSIGIKCRWLLEQGMKGAMYWDYDGDDAQGSLQRAVYEGVMER